MYIERDVINWAVKGEILIEYISGDKNDLENGYNCKLIM